MSVCLPVFVFVPVFVCVTICLYACMHTCTHPCVCMCVFMRKCMWLHAGASVHACVSLYIFLVCIFACISVSTCMHICVCVHMCLSDVQQVRRGRKSCWHARPIGHVRKDQPMNTAPPMRTVAASLPLFTLSASTCSVPFWWVHRQKMIVSVSLLKWENHSI